MSVRAKWVWAITLGLVVGSFLVFQRPIRVEYHKSRLQAVKEKRDRYMSAKLSGLEKIWLQVTGMPTSPATLVKSMRKHEDALVRFGFLRRKNFEIQAEADPEPNHVLATLRSECPWYHAEITGQTNLVIVTACPKMMERWRIHARQSGWKESPAANL